MTDNAKVKIFAGENSRYLAEQIADAAGVKLGKNTLLRFSDGEFVTSYDETGSGDHVVICQ